MKLFRKQGIWSRSNSTLHYHPRNLDKVDFERSGMDWRELTVRGSFIAWKFMEVLCKLTEILGQYIWEGIKNVNLGISTVIMKMCNK